MTEVMVSEEIRDDEDSRPQFFYDTANLSVVAVLGLKNYLRKNPEIENHVFPLDDLLLTEDSQLPRVARSQLPKMTKQVAIRRGRLVSEVVDSMENVRFNEDVLRRAGKLGITPTLFRIKQMFGSTSRYYRAVGDSSSSMSGAFDDWSSDQFLKYIASVAEETGRRPTWEGLHELSRLDVSRPSPNVIRRRFGTKGISPILEQLGYPGLWSWGQADYIGWGVRVMDANGGHSPSAKDINFLSKLDRGPSARAIANNFGSLSYFTERVADNYREKQADKAETRAKITKNIDSGITRGTLPAELFEDVDDFELRGLRFARFMILNELLSENNANRKVTIAKNDSLTLSDRRFLNAIRKTNPHVTAGELESTALYLGFFDMLMPLDGYKQKLRVLKVKRKQRILRLAFDKAITDL